MTKRRKQRGGLKPDKWLSAEQCKRLLVFVKDSVAAGTRRGATNEVIILILLFAGLRAAELLDLTIADTSWVHGKDELWVDDGKGSVSRPVDIGRELSGRIKKYIKQYRKGAKPASPLICREGGCRRVKERGMWVRSSRLGYRSLLDRVKRIGGMAGIGKLTPHMLRHTYAMNLYKTAKDLRNVQAQLGHSSSKTTEVYAMTDNEERKRQIEQMTGPLFATYD